MATLNIDRHVNDIYYRYRMPKLNIQTQGRKTILVNITDIGRALRRSPSYIVKFFSYEFGVPIRLDANENRYTMRGIQDREALQNTLDKFIEHFVLCSKCRLPETELILCKRKTNELHKVCGACGYESSDNMESQQLTTFIVKHLRDTAEDKKTVNERSDEVLQTDTDDGLSILVEQKKNEKQLNDLDTIQEIITYVELNLIEEAPLIIAKCLFTENILKEIDEYKLLFEQLCKNNFKGQKYLLYALEVLITEQENIRRQIFHSNIILEIFYKFYDYDIIENDTFIQWYEKPSKHLTDKSISKKIRQMAKEFIVWLNQSDTSDDDDSNVPIN